MKTKKIFKVYIINNDELSIMIVSSYSKETLIKDVTDFYLTIQKIRDFKKFRIFPVEVIYINGDYIEIE